MKEYQQSGTELIICPACGAEVPAGQRFCGQCGRAVAIEEPEGQGLPWLEFGLIALFGAFAVGLGVFAFLLFRPVFDAWSLGGPATAPQAAATPAPLATRVGSGPSPTAQPMAAATNRPATPAPSPAAADPATPAPTRPAATAAATRPPSTPVATVPYKVNAVRYALHPDRARLVLDLQPPGPGAPPVFDIVQRDNRLTINLKIGATPNSFRPDDRIVQSVDLTSSGERSSVLEVRLKSAVKVADYVIDNPARLAFDLIP